MKAQGEAVSREHHLLAVSVTRTVNRLPSARLVYADGTPASSDFPLSNAPTFAPGSEIEVLAGPNDDPVSLFKGVVVRQGVKVRERGSPQLIVDCRHRAFKLAVGRRSACFTDQSDGDVIASILSAAGIDAEVDDTPVVHAQLVQFDASDWDFLLARAEANGKLVSTRADAVVVKSPVLDGEAVATLLFGSSILEFDAEIDARSQFSAVKGVTWDPARQELVEREAADPGIDTPGNLSGDDLAAVASRESHQLRHVALDEQEAQAWADGEQLKSRLSRVSGRATCVGILKVAPGDVVDVRGVGERYSGRVYVTGVRHDTDPTRGCRTHVQFGGVEGWCATSREVSSPAAGALLPGVRGLQIGKVTSNEDPGAEHRVRVRLPMVKDQGEGVWARVASPDAGDGRGFFFRPELDDEVVVGFLQGDPRSPVVLGMLHSSARAAPLQGSDDNHEKVYQSRSKMRLYFHDDTKVVRLETPAGNRVTLSEEDKAVTIEDQNGNKIELGPGGVTIESAKALTLKGASGAELSSPANTVVKGALVKLNG